MTKADLATPAKHLRACEIIEQAGALNELESQPAKQKLDIQQLIAEQGTEG
jgi:hypothetical protein